jgi:hypothetical protein
LFGAEENTRMSPQTSFTRRASHFELAYIVLALLALATACKKNDGEAPAGGYVQGQVGTSPGGAGALPATAQGGAPAGVGGAAAVPAPGAAGAATGPAPITTQAGPIAVRLDATAAAAVQPILAGMVKDNVQAGAKPVGDILVGNFTQGQTLDMPIQLQPNKCYTVVATGLPPVSEVNVQLTLTTVIPGMAPVLAVDQDSGPVAVVGKKTACYKWMFGVIPAPGKVIVHVTGGNGLVAAQAYEK